jgi:hypothetical protein
MENQCITMLEQLCGVPKECLFYSEIRRLDGEVVCKYLSRCGDCTCKSAQTDSYKNTINKIPLIK